VLAAGFRPVVTTSQASIADDLRAMGRNRVDVRRWVSLPHLLPACRLAVCHGGAGTAFAALTAGIPLLLLPHGAPSQTRMSAACDRRGVARVIDQDQVRTASVEAALVDLMDDDRFRRNARDVACEIAEMPEADAAVPWLEMAGSA
jgi:UDP:flavonoid glycosyltransferase YjiC (YdhE family)